MYAQEPVAVGADGTIYVAVNLLGPDVQLQAYLPDGSLRWIYAEQGLNVSHGPTQYVVERPTNPIASRRTPAPGAAPPEVGQRSRRPGSSDSPPCVCCAVPDERNSYRPGSPRPAPRSLRKSDLERRYRSRAASGLRFRYTADAVLGFPAGGPMAWSLFGRRSAARGVVATVVVACAAPSTAAAAVLLPDGEAPQDTALWALDVYRAEVKLFGPDGAELAIDAIEAPPVGEAVLGVDPTERFPGAAWRPAQPLVVGATYELRLLDPAQSTHFTVVAAPEPAPGPPAVPAVVRTKDYAENTKDQSPCVGHDAALQGHAYTRVEVSSAGAFTLAFVEGSSGVALQAAVQTDRPTAAFDVGMSSMETPGPDPMLSADGPTTLRFGSFDLAGRFSGWTEPYVVDPPEFPAGGCAVVTGGPGLGFVLLLALRFPRRRSARAARH